MRSPAEHIAAALEHLRQAAQANGPELDALNTHLLIAFDALTEARKRLDAEKARRAA